MRIEFTFGSVCSGIEAASVAWKSLNWSPKFFAETNPYCCALLKHRYPDVPNYGDFTTIGESAGPIDLLVGGTPCQSFSVAGRRAGLDDPRGNLTLEFLRLAGRLKPRWILWENVPGILSDDGGRTFGTILGILGGLGYGFAYRILDAKYFGVPQRRRRVFVVGCLGDWRSAAAVLFESQSLQGYPSPSRETGEDVAGTLGGSAEIKRGWANDLDRSGAFIAGTLKANNGGGGFGSDPSETFIPEIAPCLTQNYAKQPDNSDTNAGPMLIPILEVHGGSSSRGEGPNGIGIGEPGDPMFTLQSGKQHAVAFSCKDSGADSGDTAPTLRAMNFDKSHANGGGQVAVAFNLRGPDGGAQPEMPAVASVRASSGGSSRSYVSHSVVRRLTPEECEALQGFPRGYTKIPYRGKPAADGNRYAAIGNSFAVPVVRWIGERIATLVSEDTNAA